MGMATTKHQKGHKWTNDELRELMRRWDAEEPVDAIAEALETTAFAVSKMVVRLRQNGIPLKRRTASASGRRRAGRAWTQSEVEYLLRRRRESATSELIGHELGRTYNSVAGMIGMLRRQGVPVAMKGQGVKRLWDPNILRGVEVDAVDHSTLADIEADGMPAN